MEKEASVPTRSGLVNSGMSRITSPSVTELKPQEVSRRDQGEARDLVFLACGAQGRGGREMETDSCDSLVGILFVLGRRDCQMQTVAYLPGFSCVDSFTLYNDLLR